MPSIDGSLALELTWTIIPLLITVVMFGWGAQVFFHLNRPPDNSMNVAVVGKRWMWKLQHPTGQREINELHVPLGRPVRLTITSEDTIHSFFIPAFRIKKDAVPGRQHACQATKAGAFHLLRGVLRLRSVRDRPRGGHGADDYQTWLAGGPTPSRWSRRERGPRSG